MVIQAKVGEGNRLFGTVTVQQLAVELQNRGISVDRRKIDLEDIRTTGEYTATIKLHPEVSASLKVVVESEAETETEPEAAEEAEA